MKASIGTLVTYHRPKNEGGGDVVAIITGERDVLHPSDLDDEGKPKVIGKKHSLTAFAEGQTTYASDVREGSEAGQWSELGD